MKRTFLIALAILLAATLGAVTAQANLIDNGDFEAPVVTASSGFTTYPPTPVDFVWTVGGAGIDHISTYWTPASGDQSLDMNAEGPGSISQQFVTVPGTTYLVSFAMAGNPELGPTLKTMDVQVLNSSSGTDYSQSYSFDITGKTKTAMGWEEESFYFIATSNLSSLQFISTTTGPCGPALDNVDVTAVPLPGAIFLLGSGLAGLAGWRRFQKV